MVGWGARDGTVRFRATIAVRALQIFALQVVVSLCAVLLAIRPGAALAAGPAANAPDSAVHLGVASCGGTTCHGRQEATGPRVRQNELLTWQDPASLTGAHQRAWSLLKLPRAQAIGARLGIGDVAQSPECINCHGDPAPVRGAQWRQADGVGCEACHGGGSKWLASHAAVGASHADNVARGMWAVNAPAVRANLCLDCHFGSAKPGQFVTHRIMAAGHPRIAFELDLFTALQSHHDEDADYAQRKGIAGGVKLWAVGQALAVQRALALYPARSGGSFPEFYFYDCRSCHRSFSDDPAVPLLARSNPARPLPPGQPVWNDEGLIVLAAAAQVAAPDLARELDARSRAFHASLAGDRGAALKAGAALSATAGALAKRFETARFDTAQTRAMLDAVLVGNAARYTDYQGGAQAVMAADTLISALVATGGLGRDQATAMRPDLDRAYAAARDANRWQPTALRGALAGIAGRVRTAP
jgi:hypothetical protein